MNFGAPEILIIGAVLVLLFGAKKLPELARSLGQAKSELERGSHGRRAADDDAASRPSEPDA